MRLIDADTFKKQIAGMTIANNYPVNKASALCDLIDAQPTAYDLDKVVEQLEEERENVGFVKATTEASAYIRGINDAIKIVKGGGIDGN